MDAFQIQVTTLTRQRDHNATNIFYTILCLFALSCYTTKPCENKSIHVPLVAGECVHTVNYYVSSAIYSNNDHCKAKRTSRSLDRMWVSNEQQISRIRLASHGCNAVIVNTAVCLTVFLGCIKVNSKSVFNGPFRMWIHRWIPFIKQW